MAPPPAGQPSYAFSGSLSGLKGGLVVTRSRIIRDFNLPVLWQRSRFYFWCPLPSLGKWLSAAQESQCSCLPPVTQQAAPDGFLPFLPCWLGANRKGKSESSWPSSPLQSLAAPFAQVALSLFLASPRVCMLHALKVRSTKCIILWTSERGRGIGGASLTQWEH